MIFVVWQSLHVRALKRVSFSSDDSANSFFFLLFFVHASISLLLKNLLTRPFHAQSIEMFSHVRVKNLSRLNLVGRNFKISFEIISFSLINADWFVIISLFDHDRRIEDWMISIQTIRHHSGDGEDISSSWWRFLVSSMFTRFALIWAWRSSQWQRFERSHMRMAPQQTSNTSRGTPFRRATFSARFSTAIYARKLSAESLRKRSAEVWWEEKKMIITRVVDDLKLEFSSSSLESASAQLQSSPLWRQWQLTRVCTL